MLPVVFIVQNPKTYNLVMGCGTILFLFLIGNYLMVRSFRRIWAGRLINNHVKAVNKYIETSIKEGDPWLLKLFYTVPPPQYSHITLQDIFYNCIWSYEMMIKDYSVWSLDKMVINRELFDRVYKKDSK